MSSYTKEIEELNTPVIKFIKVSVEIKRAEQQLERDWKDAKETWTVPNTNWLFRDIYKEKLKELKNLENEFLVLFKKLIVECQ